MFPPPFPKKMRYFFILYEALKGYNGICGTNPSTYAPDITGKGCKFFVSWKERKIASPSGCLSQNCQRWGMLRPSPTGSLLCSVAFARAARKLHVPSSRLEKMVQFPLLVCGQDIQRMAGFARHRKLCAKRCFHLLMALFQAGGYKRGKVLNRHAAGHL